MYAGRRGFQKPCPHSREVAVSGSVHTMALPFRSEAHETVR